MYTHRKGVLAGASHTYTHTPAAVLSAPERHPECGPVKATIETNHSTRCSGNPSTKAHKDAHTHTHARTSRMSHFFHEDHDCLDAKLSAGEVTGGRG